MRTHMFAWLAAGVTALLFATAVVVTAQEGSAQGTTVLQIMEQTVVPESTALFEVTDAPTKADEWVAARRHAVAIVGTGESLLAPARSRDKGEWVAQVRAFVEAGSRIAKAAEVRNFNAFLEASDALAETCVNCHAKYLGKP